LIRTAGIIPLWNNFSPRGLCSYPGQEVFFFLRVSLTASLDRDRVPFFLLIAGSPPPASWRKGCLSVFRARVSVAGSRSPVRGFPSRYSPREWQFRPPRFFFFRPGPGSLFFFFFADLVPRAFFFLALAWPFRAESVRAFSRGPCLFPRTELLVWKPCFSFPFSGHLLEEPFAAFLLFRY